MTRSVPLAAALVALLTACSPPDLFGWGVDADRTPRPGSGDALAACGELRVFENVANRTPEELQEHINRGIASATAAGEKDEHYRPLAEAYQGFGAAVEQRDVEQVDRTGRKVAEECNRLFVKR